MARNTCCWRCSTFYNRRARACKHCGAANANVDADKANAEAFAWREPTPSGNPTPLPNESTNREAANGTGSES
jgi:hypothetical protein